MRSKKDMMCSCGKPKGSCKCGTSKVKGYYMGDAAVATPQQEQEMMAMLPGFRAQAPLAPPEEGPSPLAQAATGLATAPVSNYVMEQGSMALDSAKDLMGGKVIGETAGDAAYKTAVEGGKSATEAVKASAAATDAATAASGAASSALSGFGGAAAADLLTKGKVDEKTLLKGGLAMGANMLLPGSGFLVGPVLSAFGLQDGTAEVPPMGYANGSKEISPEEYQMNLIKERILNPAEAYVEERPMLQAPLFLAGAAQKFSRGKLPLGSFGGGKLEGGKDRIAYRHDTLGDIEYNPKDERVMYKKTIRF